MNNIKNNRMIRILAKPFWDRKRKKEFERYLCTPDHYYLMTLKGIHKDKRCFILGNGPSLCACDLDLLQNEYTFASNRIFKIFDQTDWRPSYYLSIDDNVLKEIQGELEKYDLGHLFLRYGTCKLNLPTNKLTRIYDRKRNLNISANPEYCDMSLYISENVSEHFCAGRTVTFHAIQLAIYMGFREIYLLGVDHNYSTTLDTCGNIHTDTTIQDYFDNKRYASASPAPLTTMQYGYVIAREYCEAHGIKIFNATRGGKLEVFERVDFDEIMRKTNEE